MTIINFERAYQQRQTQEREFAMIDEIADILGRSEKPNIPSLRKKYDLLHTGTLDGVYEFNGYIELVGRG